MVERSNRIHARLKNTAARHPEILQALAALPMLARYRVGDARVGVVHGDADALAGWRFDVAALDDAQNQGWIDAVFAQAEVDVFASTHTCLPALRTLQCFDKRHAIINNGAAGMPNFADTHFGVATRISINPCPPAIRLYGTRFDDVFIDAIKLHYDHRAFVEQFDANWPADSPARASYYSRIVNGPAFTPEQALAATRKQQIRQQAG